MGDRRLVRTNSIEGFGKISPRSGGRRKRSGSGIGRDISILNIAKTFREAKIVLSPRSVDPMAFPEQTPKKPWDSENETCKHYIYRMSEENKDYQFEVEVWRQRLDQIAQVETVGEWARRIDPECKIRNVETLLAMWKERALEIYKSLEKAQMLDILES